ncbi:MAG: creatininase family protein [Armatimonadota bacterium]|nr:creatininase family protein [Armatimonadota bacterium]MDW8025414.1 creatininase family protein [Armatimonadota bacterium]
MNEPKVYLPELTREEVKELAPIAVLLVPVATIEQHGPHAPLHTDIDNCFHICVMAAKRVHPNPPTLVGAPVWFSPSPFDPAWQPISICMREEVFKEALNDILESYLRGGFRRIVVVNGHGGGTEWIIPQVIQKLNRKVSSIWRDWQIPDDARIVTFEWTAFLEVFAQDELAKIRTNPPGSDWHAGDIETSIQLYLHPELVDMSRAKVGHRYKKSSFSAHDLGRNWFWQYIIAGSPYVGGEGGEVEGVSGDPTLATEELGEKILNVAAEKIAEFIREFSKS